MRRLKVLLIIVAAIMVCVVLYTAVMLLEYYSGPPGYRTDLFDATMTSAASTNSAIFATLTAQSDAVATNTGGSR